MYLIIFPSKRDIPGEKSGNVSHQNQEKPQKAPEVDGFLGIDPFQHFMAALEALRFLGRHLPIFAANWPGGTSRSAYSPGEKPIKLGVSVDSTFDLI